MPSAKVVMRPPPSPMEKSICARARLCTASAVGVKISRPCAESRGGLMNRPFSPVLLAAILLSCSGSGFVRDSAAQTPKQIRAGAAATNVTPWLGLSINGSMQDRRVNRIHDELHARSLALDDGRNRIVITVVDSCMISREVFDEAKRLVAQHTGLPAHHMLMSATHTHSAPTTVPLFQRQADAEYLRFLMRRIADSVRRALDNLQPAEIGWGTGKVPQHVFNRRWK